MQTYEDVKAEIVRFLAQSNISPYDLLKITKSMCCCGKCRHFVAHYLADGNVTDFGHCQKNKIPKCVRPKDISCGYWEIGGDAK